MEGEERSHRRELLQAHFEKMGSDETEHAVVQRYRIQGLQGAAGIVAWPWRGKLPRDGRDEVLDGCWVLSSQNAVVRFNPRTAREQARDSAATGFERGTWAGLELLAGGQAGNVESTWPRVQDEDGEWTSSARFRRPEGVAIDAAGNVVVADSGNNAIRSVSRNGVVHLLYQYERPSRPPMTPSAGIVLPLQDALPELGCLPPHGVCVLRDGRIVVSHGGVVAGEAQLVERGAQLTLLSPVLGSQPPSLCRVNGGFERRVSTPHLRGAMGLALANDGNVVVADQMENRLAMVSSKGVTTVCGGPGGGAMSFDKPTAVVVDRAGAMIVADWRNGRLRKVTVADGEVRVTALDWEEGSGAVLGGRALDADEHGRRRLPFRPFALALDTEGRLLVLDSSYPSDVLVVDYSGRDAFMALRERELTGWRTARVPRVRFDDRVGYREATLLQMQAALAQTGVRSGGAAGSATPLTLLDLPPTFWEHTDDSALRLLRTSKTLRLALERRVPGATEPGKPTVSVRLNRAWFESLGSAPRVPRIDSVLAELARTSQVYSITTLELVNIFLHGTEAALATAISRSTALTRLHLTECRINAAGCRRLAEALLPCTKLVALDLGGNELGEGVADVADVLPRLPALAEVTLNRCGPHYGSRASGERLALALPQCTALTQLNVFALFGTADGFPIEPVIAALPQCTALVKLDLGFNTCDANDADTPGGGLLARNLARCPGLKDLELHSCRLNDETMQELGATGALTALTRLNLASNQIREAGARSLGLALPACTALRELNLSRCGDSEEIFGALGPGLAACPALRRLDVNGFAVGAGECRALLAALRESPSLTELHMERMKPRLGVPRSSWSVASELAEVLGAWPTLRKLDLNMSGVRDEDLIALLAGGGCTALRELNVSGCKITDTAGLALAEALPRLALVRLNLSCNEMREASVLALLGALPACPELTSVDLYGSSVRGEAWHDVATRLLKVLPRCPWLRELDLRSHFRSMVLPREAERLRAAWLLATGQDGPRYDSATSRGNHELSCAGLRLTVFTGST